MPVRVKICGVTTPADVRLAVEAGADAVGFNFSPRSPRYVEPRAAAALVRELPPLVDAVGVFVHDPLRVATAVAFQLGLGTIQHYAGATPDFSDPFPFRLVRCFSVRDRESLSLIESRIAASRDLHAPPAAILVDAFVPGQLGGTGVQAPWEVLTDWRPGVPLILAGGLTPDNVATAIQSVRPYAVDVASGVESAPGRKDPGKLRAFIAAARAAAG